MAEIEFKRRGTPLWAVVLVLIVIAGVVWAIFGRGGTTAPATADSAASVAPPADSADSARQAAAAGVALPSTAPAAAAGPAAQFAAWVDSTRSADPRPAHIGKGLQLLSAALQERVPLAGAQINMTRAMGDTLLMPGLTSAQYVNAAQAGFFAVAYALRQTNASGPINEQAAMIQLNKSLDEQKAQVRSFFITAADVMKAPIQGEAAPPSSPPPPVGPLPVPPSQKGAATTPGSKS